MHFDLNHTGTTANNITFWPINTPKGAHSQVKIGIKTIAGWQSLFLQTLTGT
jgi:hypothetical protein